MGAKGETKGAKSEPKGAKSEPKGGKSEPKGDQNVSKSQPLEKVAKQVRKWVPASGKFGSHFGTIFHQKVDQKIVAEFDAEKVSILMKNRCKNGVRF